MGHKPASCEYSLSPSPRETTWRPGCTFPTSYESTLSQLIYCGPGRRLFRYAEEKEDFPILEQYARAPVKEKSIVPSSDDATLNDPTTRQSDCASTFVEKENAHCAKKVDDPKEGMMPPPKVQQDELEEYGPNNPEYLLNVSVLSINAAQCERATSSCSYQAV
ncbi:hypothetical protein FOMPIDRAFT_1055140 [Fomitopsis schrenkii]|uniref:Uncharacterized protein n=1 Tax=Fomitopsis schrenkii TaxID=2126942 RepID=S8F647_FOMSC|nr:hypothetical protein FOMPIDRAFT_1055140 [Fomitopsis schrenkii]